MSQMSFEEMFSMIDEAIKGESYGIGIHGVSSHRSGAQREEIASNILQEGMNISEGRTILATVSSLGTTSNLESHQKRTISSYTFGREEGKCNVLIAVPTQIKTEQGSIYLGFPDVNTDTAANQYKITCVLDSLCCSDNKEGVIPKEFILGYYTEEPGMGENEENKQVTFVKNEKHYSCLSEQEKQELLSGLQEKLNGRYKLISDAAIANDTQTLEKLSQEENEYNREMYLKKRRELLENGIVNEELVKALTGSHEISAARQAKEYVREKQLETRDIHTVGTRRKIPIGLLTDDNNDNNPFIRKSREQTNSMEEVAENYSKDEIDKNNAIEDRTYSEEEPII